MEYLPYLHPLESVRFAPNLGNFSQVFTLENADSFFPHWGSR